MISRAFHIQAVPSNNKHGHTRTPLFPSLAACASFVLCCAVMVGRLGWFACSSIANKYRRVAFPGLPFYSPSVYLCIEMAQFTPKHQSRQNAEDDNSPKPLSTAIMQELANLKEKFKNDDEEDTKGIVATTFHFHQATCVTSCSHRSETPYQHLDKAAVLQECKVFHDQSVVTQNPRRCCLLITKLLFLLVKGDTFTSAEITEVFFGVTKLFQSPDVNLRRMMYLFIKEIAETCDPDDVIIVTQSLTKDMNTGEDLYRANSMRVLAKIIDSSMLGAIERYLKQAIVDRNAFVASSSLMAGSRLFKTCPDVVRRWINEVQEAVNSVNDMVQFHALSLLYQIKQHDRLAVSKTVQTLSKGSLRSPLATCLLIRYTKMLLVEDMTSANAKAAYAFLESCLRHKNEMVIFEAAKAICNLPGVEANDLNPAITVLQLLLSSTKPALRFTAMRVLSEVAGRHPISVAKCNDDMESLVGDNNRSIATLAITTLLKTGNEASIDRLMKQISSFMSEIGDEFKVVVVKAVRDMCVKYPGKHRVMVNFLATFLREEGGFEFKKAIVDSILEIMKAIPETKESSLMHLCEFIEDYEFDELIIRVLHLIGTIGPTTSSPSKYIRFVYNRIILESSNVRAAAITTLGNLAVQLPELRSSILMLLEKSLDDDDDEVRERAALLYGTLQSYPAQAAPVDDAELATADRASELELKFLFNEKMPMDFSALERSVRAFIQHPNYDKPITFSSLPIIEAAYVPPVLQPGQRSVVAAKKGGPDAALLAPAAASLDPASVVYDVPELAYLGRAFRTCPEVALTETEVEYVVKCVKHIFAEHVVLQFSVMNTIDDQSLRGVHIALTLSDEESYSEEKTISASVARYGEKANTFVVLKRNTDAGFQDLTCSCQLMFKVVQVNPTTGEVEGDEDGYDDEYALEDLDLQTRDYMAKVQVGDFRRVWEQMGSDGEVLEKFGLQFKKLEDALVAVAEFLGMAAVDGTGVIPTGADGAKRSHTLHMSGMFLGNVSVLVRAQLQIDDAGTVVLKLAVRSEDASISEVVSGCIQ